MIKSLHLSNFQSHKDSALEFDPGVNVIVGASDSGKTAIIRALRWLIWNRPSGEEFISNWGGIAEIILDTGEEYITRIKGEGDNAYFLDEQEFVAFKTEIPEEIQQVLNINEINLQSQLDAPFLLSDSPGEVAKHFNKIAHLDQIDSGLKNVQKWIRDIEQNISSSNKQVIQLTEDLEKFVHLDKFEIDVEVLETMESQMISQVNNKRTVERLCLELRDVENLITEQEKITAAGPLVDTILNWYTEEKQTKQKADELKELIGEIYRAEDELEEENEILGAEKEVNQLLSLFEEQTEKRNRRFVLIKLVEEIQYITEQKISSENRSKRLQTEFNAVFPDVCPLCGKPK